MASKETKLFLRSLVAGAAHHIGVASMIQKGEKQPWRILTYHRVLNPETLRYPLQPGMYITPKTFDMQLRYLKEEANVVSLDSLASSIARGEKLPSKTIALTFDDGWVDTYTNAFPIIKEYDLPVTVLLPTAYIGTSNHFWTDTLQHSLYALHAEPQYRQTVISRLRDCENLSKLLAQDLSDLLLLEPDESFIDKLDSVIEAVKQRPYKERSCVLNIVNTLAKEFTTHKSDRAFMNWDEVQEMAASGITFGSHSHQHFHFSELSEAQINDELGNSYQAFRSKDITPTPIFCYPGGSYTETSQKVLSEHHLRFALTTETRANLEASPILLGRINIHEDISNTPSLFSSRVWIDGVF